MTFESVPTDYSSVNSNLVYVVYDAHATDGVTYPNYKYVGELWVDGVKVYTSRVFPQPDSLRGIFDFGNVVREYVIATLQPTGAGVEAQQLPAGQWVTQDVVVKIREEYGGAVGAVVLTDSARVYFNHYNGLYYDFTLLSAYAEEILTTRPDKINITLPSANYFVPYFAETAGTFDVAVTDDQSNVNIFTVTTSTDNVLVLLNLSPAAINSDYPGAITSATLWYDIAFSSGGRGLRFELICTGMYKNYFVHFLNQFGGFETMLFNKVRRRSIDVEKKSWRQLPYRVSSAGVVSVKTGSIMHSQQTTFASKYKEGLKISTDWLTDAEYTWLAQLVQSPLVYLEVDAVLYPIQITDTNYEPKENIVDSLQNLTIGTDFATMYKTQHQ